MLDRPQCARRHCASGSGTPGRRSRGNVPIRFRRARHSKGRRPHSRGIRSEYGFSKELALRLCEHIAAVLPRALPRMVDLAHHEIVQWEREAVCLFVCSTAGDGDPPVSARPFLRLVQEGQPLFASTAQSAHFVAVLAPGDSAYPNFCAAAKALHTALERQPSSSRCCPCANSMATTQRMQTLGCQRFATALLCAY